MIENVTKPQCYNAFYSVKHEKPMIEHKDTPLNVKVVSLVSSGIGALGTAYCISRNQSAKLNKAINLFNIKYEEPELLKVALSSVVTGLAGGIIADDKKYIKPKINEAIHQVVANIIAPLAFISLGNKLFDMVEHKINLPQLAETSKFSKIINISIKTAPRVGIAIAGLVAGLYSGTKIANIITGRNNTKKARKVKAIDYIYHPDDFATALVLADRKGVLQKTVGKIIPPVFMLHGYEAGTKR